MRDFEPTSIRSAVLLRKHGRQEVDYQPDFVAFDIPDEFVVGYGLDYEDMYRNLPYLAALEPEDIARHKEMTAASDAAIECNYGGSRNETRLCKTSRVGSRTRPHLHWSFEPARQESIERRLVAFARA